MARHANPVAKVSPKVTFPAIVVLALTTVATFFAAITPQMLAGLGQWAVPLALICGLVAQFITGYLKSDPARVDTQETTSPLDAVASVQAE